MLSNSRSDTARAAALYPWLIGSAAALTTLAAFRFLLLRPATSDAAAADLRGELPATRLEEE